MARVLVVDDDPALLRALRLALRAAHHDVITTTNGTDGLEQVTRVSPEVVILDLGLPDMDGMTVCRRIRAWSDVPIIVLSATSSEDRKVAALDEGADDYVTKPFGMAELEARIRAVLRHRVRPENDGGPDQITVGSLHLDLVRHQADIDGTLVELTAKEFDVLAFLASNPGKLCTHQMILRAVWGSTYSKEAQYLHAYIHRLRQKLGEESSVVIKTAPGVGYSINAEATPHP